jgi:hypothetical protein
MTSVDTPPCSEGHSPSSTPTGTPQKLDVDAAARLLQDQKKHMPRSSSRSSASSVPAACDADDDATATLMMHHHAIQSIMKDIHLMTDSDMDKYPPRRGEKGHPDPLTPPNEPSTSVTLKDQVASAQGLRRHTLPSSALGVKGSATFRNQQSYGKGMPALGDIPESDLASFYPSADAATFVPQQPAQTNAPPPQQGPAVKDPPSAAQWYFGSQAAPNLIPQSQTQNMRTYPMAQSTQQPMARYSYNGTQRPSAPMMNTPFYEHAGMSALMSLQILTLYRLLPNWVAELLSRTVYEWPYRYILHSARGRI